MNLYEDVNWRTQSTMWLERSEKNILLYKLVPFYVLGLYYAFGITCF